MNYARGLILAQRKAESIPLPQLTPKGVAWLPQLYANGNTPAGYKRLYSQFAPLPGSNLTPVPPNLSYSWNGPESFTVTNGVGASSRYAADTRKPRADLYYGEAKVWYILRRNFNPQEYT